MSRMPNWLVRTLKAEEVLQLYRDADAACQDLADCIEVARMVTEPSETGLVGAEQEKLVEETTAYLDVFPTQSLWYKFKQIDTLEQLIADLSQHADALAKIALPHLDPFVERLQRDHQAAAKALLSLNRKGWDVRAAAVEVFEAQILLSEICCLPRPDWRKSTVLRVCAVHRHVTDVFKIIHYVEEQETKQRAVQKLLDHLRSEQPARRQRLDLQVKQLNHFKAVCASWRDIEGWLDEANRLFADLTGGIADLETLIEQGETAAALAMGAELQTNCDKVKSLCGQSNQTRIDRRQLLKEAADTATNQLRRTWQLVRSPGNHELRGGLRNIQGFVAAYRKAVKDHGSLLTVGAIVEQAQAIPRAIDDLVANPHAPADVAVQDEFAELGCFPE